MADLSYPRRARLLEALDGRFDAVVITRPEHVYYFTGLLPAWRLLPGLLIEKGGKTTLVWPNQPIETSAIDRCVSYVAHFSGTLRQDQALVVADELAKLIKNAGIERFAADASATAACLGGGDIIDRTLHQLRRRKDEAELALQRKAAAACGAMYAKAREIIVPGIAELDVFTALHAAAVESTQEPMTHLLGNDFACGVAGGPARAGHVAKAGELYVLDLGPTYRGYFADTCRTIAVNRQPTDAQRRAWQTIADCFPMIERLAKPGVSCRELSQAVDDRLRATAGVGLPHHLGHGVGLASHERPHLNLQSADVLEEGDVFSAEPGIYAPELAGGIRLENTYRVTADGVECLTPFPLGLK